jgi:hypothetical protein
MGRSLTVSSVCPGPTPRADTTRQIQPPAGAYQAALEARGVRCIQLDVAAPASAVPLARQGVQRREPCRHGRVHLHLAAAAACRAPCEARDTRHCTCAQKSVGMDPPPLQVDTFLADSTGVFYELQNLCVPATSPVRVPHLRLEARWGARVVSSARGRPRTGIRECGQIRGCSVVRVVHQNVERDGFGMWYRRKRRQAIETRVESRERQGKPTGSYFSRAIKDRRVLQHNTAASAKVGGRAPRADRYRQGYMDVPPGWLYEGGPWTQCGPSRSRLESHLRSS